MEETIRQYKQRILNTLGDREPMEVLQTTPDKLDTATRALEQKGTASAAPDGKWSAAEILSHYAEGEIVFSYRLRRIVTESGNPIEAYDQNLWVKHAGYLQADPALALSLFRTLRRTNVALLQSLKPEQWANYGIHSERGKETVTDLVRLYAGHDLNHLEQILALVV